MSSSKDKDMMNSSEHGSSLSRSSSSCGEASLVTSSLTSDGSGTTSPTESSNSSMSASSQFPGNVAAMLQQLKQGTPHNSLAQASALVQKALADEIKRAQHLQWQLAALDRAAIAQATAAQQQAALLASSGVSIPPALQQATAVNAFLLNGSLAAQAQSAQVLTPLQLGVLAGTASALQLQASMTLNNNNLMPQPGIFSTTTLAQTAVPQALSKAEYRDASLIPDPVAPTTTGRSEPFPVKLHRMLSELEQEGKDDVCSFLPHGRAFTVHKPKQFAEEIMPKYFRMSRFSSFQRQLNLYDFKRLTEGKDKGAYYHELFLYGRPALTIQMKRTKIKGSAPWGSGSVYQEGIDFYKMPPVPRQAQQQKSPPVAQVQQQQEEEERSVETLDFAVATSG